MEKPCATKEALILAEKCEPDENKSDEKERDPTTTEPSDQVSDHKPDTITSTLRWPMISRLSKQNMLDIFGYAPQCEHMLLAIFVCEPEAEKSDEGEKSPEPMEPPDQASDPGCLPEVIPTMRSPPTNSVPEIKIGPIYQYPKEFKLAECGAEQEVAREEYKVSVNEKTDVLTHQQEDKDFAQSEITPSKKKAKKKIIPLKVTQPLPEMYIPIYPCLKDLMAEYGGQEAPNAPVDAKNGVQESTKNSSDQSGNNSPQSENIPSKDKIIKKKITFKIIHPSPLPKKDWYLTLKVKGLEEKKKFRIESFTNQNQEWTSPPLIFDVGKDDNFFLSVVEKKKKNLVPCPGY
uniref:Uncharacterized protein n=1 Tax=Daphnia galeata TaxID=27404 RepID=A0A8J2WJR6_9CRUS|nr:unnamed protein product [Daphnia galeata]